MADRAPLEAHLFICTNLKEKGECCGAKGGAELRAAAKEMAKRRGWKGRVRVNAAGCLGRCEEGIAAVLYPQAKWMTRLTTESLPELERVLEEALERNPGDRS